MIKLRKAKKSNRGLYIQDKELRQTAFEVGSHFEYIVDQTNKQLMIVPATNSTKNTVSKRALKDGLKPVLDIRDKKALSIFNQTDILQIEIDENYVRVTAYEAKQQTENVAAKSGIQNVFSKKQKTRKVIELAKFGKKKYEVYFSKEQLQQAVGGLQYQQLSLFDEIETISSFKSDSIQYAKSALKNVPLALRAISLFSGAGIMDIPFIEEGFDVVFAIEKDEHAVETYRYNHGEHIVHGDITELDKSVLNTLDAPILFGGSPCQGFSRANAKTRFLDNPNNLLVREYIEAVKANLQCQVFILENVPELLKAGEGQFKDEIIAELSDFEITYGILNGADFGDSQLRERAFMIGSKIGKIELPVATHTKDVYKTVEQAFYGITNDLPNQKDISKSRAATVEQMSYVPQGGNWKDIPSHLLSDSKSVKKTHSSMYRRLHLKRPSVTVVNPRKTLLTHPTENRTLSIRECARLFSIPDTFRFKGTLQAMQQQICNAVPVEMARSIVKKVKEAIIQANACMGKRKNFRLI